jgi:hypothetical protein
MGTGISSNISVLPPEYNSTNAPYSLTCNRRYTISPINGVDKQPTKKLRCVRNCFSWRLPLLLGQGLFIIEALPSLRHTTVVRTPLDEWWARRWDLYLTTHNTHNRQESMLPAGFESVIPTSERPQTHALEHAATGIGPVWNTRQKQSLYLG